MSIMGCIGLYVRMHVHDSCLFEPYEPHPLIDDRYLYSFHRNALSFIFPLHNKDEQQ